MTKISTGSTSRSNSKSRQKDGRKEYNSREARRFRALALKEQGWKQAEIAKELGVTPGAVSQWLKRAREGGREALQTRKGGGPKPRLREDQIKRLPALLAEGPQTYGFRGNLWTRSRIIAVIHQVYGVQFSPGHIGRIMRKGGVRLRDAVHYPHAPFRG
jgi:transposase